MLEIMQDGAMQTLDLDDYYIQEEWNGADNLLHLSLPRSHPQMLSLQERTQIYESESGQVYRVSKYDRGKSTLDLEAELDLDSLCAGALISWDNRADADGTQWMTLGATVAAILKDTGWTLDDQSGRVDVQQMETFNGTPLEAITQAVEVWGNDLGVQYDNAKKVVHLFSPGQRQPTGAYLTEDLNLLEAPQVRGKAPRGEYYNRLYLIGADGLTLPKPYYVEHRAVDEPIVSHVETNADIADLDTLQATARSMVETASTIQRSYTCQVADLYRLRPQEYAHLKIGLYDTVILIDRDDYSRSYQEIARFRRYPQHPEKNEVTLSTVPGTLSANTKKTISLARDAAARAYSARKAAQQASLAADSASQTAGSASQAAQQANQTANSANQAAQQAGDIASGAAQTAQQAAQTANNAAQTAAQANQTANSASQTANSANQAAQQAGDLANSANKTASNANQIAQQAGDLAHSATQTANSATQAAQQAGDLANSATQTANSASQAAQQAGDLANSANQAAQQAGDLANSANQAAQQAGQAAEDASKVATDYIQDDGSTVTVSRPGGGAGMGMGEHGLSFDGIRNKTALWTNSDILAGADSPSAFPAQTIPLDLSSYSAILILYTSSVSGSWFAGSENGEMTSIVLPVNGLTTTMLYPYNTITRRNVRVSNDGVQFFGGYERWQQYNTGIIASFELKTPWNSGWDADNSCCVPCYIYGFM